MTIDTKALRDLAERYAQDDMREDLDAQEWGEAMTPYHVIALCERLEEAEQAFTIARTLRDAATERAEKAERELAECRKVVSSNKDSR